MATPTMPTARTASTPRLRRTTSSWSSWSATTGSRAWLRSSPPSWRPRGRTASGSSWSSTARSTPRSTPTCSATRRRPTSECCAPASRRERPQAEAAVVLVRRGDDGQYLACRPLAERDLPSARERCAQQAFHSGECRGRQGEDAPGSGTGPADGTAGPRRVADEGSLSPALRAAAQVREVAGQPEQLELEGEAERVELGPTGGSSGPVVQQVEEAGQRLEGARACLLLVEEAEHRLRTHEPDAEPVRILANRRMRMDEVGARLGRKLPGALVQNELHVAQGLQPPAETRARLADTLRHRPDAAPGEGVEVEHAVGLAEPERAEDDRLGLEGASRHGSSLVRALAGRRTRSIERVEGEGDGLVGAKRPASVPGLGEGGLVESLAGGEYLGGGLGSARKRQHAGEAADDDGLAHAVAELTVELPRLPEQRRRLVDPPLGCGVVRERLQRVHLDVRVPGDTRLREHVLHEPAAAIRLTELVVGPGEHPCRQQRAEGIAGL